MTDVSELEQVQEELRLHKEDLEKLVSERTMKLQQANEQLRENKEELEAVFEPVPLAIGVFDNQGRFVGQSGQRAGFRVASVGGERSTDPIFPQGDPAVAEALLQRILQGESVEGIEPSSSAGTAAASTSDSGRRRYSIRKAGSGFCGSGGRYYGVETGCRGH